MSKENMGGIVSLIKEHRVFQRANVGERDCVPESMFDETGKKEKMILGLREEMKEFLAEITVQKISRVDAVEEMADIVIRSLDAAAHMCQAFGITPEEFDGIVVAKMEKTKQKYAPEHFVGRTAEEGMKETKRQWKRRQLKVAMNGV